MVVVFAIGKSKLGLEIEFGQKDILLTKDNPRRAKKLIITADQSIKTCDRIN